MKKNKLVYIITLSTFGGEQIGGAQIHVLNLIRHINFQKYQVFLIVGNEGVLTKKVREMGVKVCIANKMNNPVNLIKDHTAINQIRKFLKDIKPDIVHTHSSKAGFLGRIAAYKEKVPLILHTIQGFIFPRVKGFRRMLYLKAERYVGRRSDLLISVSHQEKRFAIENKVIKNEELIKVIGNGYEDSIDWDGFSKIDLPKKYNFSKDRKVLGFIARLDHDKNPMEFLRAIKYLVDSNKIEGLQFLLIGEGTEKVKCLNFIEENKLSEFVSVGGWLKQNPYYYMVVKSLDVMVLTSFAEGLPLGVIESMRIGTPIIGSDVPGINELVKNNETGVIYELSDYKKLGEKMLELVWNSEKLACISKTAKEFIMKNFSYSKITDKHMRLYEDYLQKQEIK